MFLSLGNFGLSINLFISKPIDDTTIIIDKVEPIIGVMVRISSSKTPVIS